MPEAIGVVHISESSSQTPPPPPQTRVPAGRASHGLCSQEPGSLWAGTWGLHPPETWAGAPGACPRSYQLLWSCRQAGSAGMVLGSQLRVPRKGPGQTQRLPKQQNTTHPPFRRLPPPYPHAREKRGMEPAPQLCRNSSKLPSFGLHPGSPARPGRSPAKPSQVLINHVRYFVHHISRHLRGRQRMEEKKNRLMQPQPSLFSFFLSG